MLPQCNFPTQLTCQAPGDAPSSSDSFPPIIVKSTHLIAGNNSNEQTINIEMCVALGMRKAL